MTSYLLVPSSSWHRQNPSSLVLKLSTSNLTSHVLELTHPLTIYICWDHSWMFWLTNRYVQKHIWYNFFPLWIISYPTSFWRFVKLVHHYLISTPPSTFPLFITENQTNKIPCLLEGNGAPVRVGTIFYLIVERINVIVSLIGTTLKNDIRNLWYSTW